LEVVVIMAPARFHAEPIVAAAGAGKAVFCEQPAALSLADLDRALHALRAAEVVLQVGFNRRSAPGQGRGAGDSPCPAIALPHGRSENGSGGQLASAMSAESESK
jgi:Oxidoreductase family, NAD-binding Rossmann fold